MVTVMSLLSFTNPVIDTACRLLPQFLGWLGFWFSALVVFLRADWERTTLYGIIGCVATTYWFCSAVLFAVWGNPVLCVLALLATSYAYSLYKRGASYGE